MQTAVPEEAVASATLVLSQCTCSSTVGNSGLSSETDTLGGRVAGWPSVPSLDDLHRGEKVKAKKSVAFRDADISLEAAGFVGSDSLSMIFARWPGWLLLVSLSAYNAFYAAAYGSRFLETGLEPDDELLALLVLTHAIPAGLGPSCLLLGMRGHAKPAVRVAGLGMFLQAFILLGCWVIPAIRQSEVELAVESAVRGVMYLDIAWTLSFKEAWWLYLGMRLALVFYLTIAILGGGFGYLHVLHMLPEATCYFVLVTYLLARRRWSLRKATLGMKEDECRYNEVWNPLAERSREELVLLSELVNRVKNERVLQPFESLGAIYKRAAVLNPWFQAVVRHWAALCGVQLHAAPIKAKKRAKEKVRRSYSGDFRRVLDIVRSTIVVQDIADVARVFDVVVSQARVHQVKNRFDPSFDSGLTGGYRDLNCQLTFPQLEHTEFQGFVFELQVHLADILALKSDEGHKRYIKLRNLRGD